jgi:hypothetical protein
MAKAKKAKKEKAKSKKGRSIKSRLLSIFALIAIIVFMPTAIIVVFGMMPTLVLAAFETNKRRTKALTVGPLNLAGCMPFLFHLWDTGAEFDNAVIIVTNPLSISVMWGAAAVGYIIFWCMTGIVGAFVTENAKARLKAIKKHQDRLVERWGPEVTGEYELDAHGFAIKMPEEDDDGFDV